MSELVGIGRLKSKLASKKNRVLLRYEYYDQKHKTKDNWISTPETERHIKSTLGWTKTSVDTLANRLSFKGFKNDNFDMQEIFDMNNPDVFFDSAILSALISACSFVYILQGEDGIPDLQVIDGSNATGIINQKTGLLKEGYAILETDDDGNPTIEAYFTPDYTEYFEKGKEPYTIDNPTGNPLLVPIVFRPSDKRPFGHSRISRACMSIQDCACRTVSRTELSSEFYSYPQKWLSGTSQDLDLDKWKASMSSMLNISKDEDGDKPTIGQFSQQSMGPHLDQLQMYVKLFCGETGLTADDLGYVSANPTSSDAIKAGHGTLNLIARKAQKSFGRGFLNVGYVAACLRDEYPYRRKVVYQTKPMWEPIFETDAQMLSGIGDGAIKVNQAVPGYFNKDNLSEMTGIEASELAPVESGEA